MRFAYAPWGRSRTHCSRLVANTAEACKQSESPDSPLQLGMFGIFAPTDDALESLAAAIDVTAYAKTRNHLNGRVTRLSPYLTHGFTSIPALFARLPQLTLADKLAFEFGWREFFHHVWHRSGDAILSDLRPALAGVIYAKAMPEDIREGRTGLSVIDKTVHTLYETGYQIGRAHV